MSRVRNRRAPGVMTWLLVVMLCLPVVAPLGASAQGVDRVQSGDTQPTEPVLEPPAGTETPVATDVPAEETPDSPTETPVATETTVPTETPDVPTETPAVTETPAPTVTPTATATSDPEFSAAQIWFLDFDQDTYTAAPGETLNMTLTLFLNGETSEGPLTVIMPLGATVQGISLVAFGDVQCGNLTQISGPAYGATIRGSGLGSCDYTITVKIADSAVAGVPLFAFANAGTAADPTRWSTAATITVTAPPPPTVTFDQASYAGTGGETIEITMTITTHGTTYGGVVTTQLVSIHGSSTTSISTSATGSMTCSETGFESPGGGGTCTYVFTLALGTYVVIDYDDALHVGVASFLPTSNQLVTRAIDVAKPADVSRAFAMDISDRTPLPGDTVLVTLALRGTDLPPGDLGQLLSTIPAGTTIVAGSPSVTCAPECQFPPEVNAVGAEVSATGSLAPGGTLTLTYRLIIPSDTTPGTLLTVTGAGRVFAAPPPFLEVGIASIELVVASPIDASDATITVPSGGSGSGQVTATGGSGPITFALQDQGTRGTATVAPDGTFTYQTTPGETGTDTFTVLASDGAASDLATVTVMISATGALLVTPLILSAVPDQTMTVDLVLQVSGGVLPYTFALTTEPTQGTATLTPGGILTYSAGDDASGTDTLTYSVTDSATGVTAAATTTGTVAIVIAPPGSDPTPTEPVLTPSPTLEPGVTPSPTVEVTPSATTDPDATATPGEDPTATGVPGGDPDDGGPITKLPSTGTGDAGSSAVLLLIVAALGLLAAAILTGRHRNR